MTAPPLDRATYDDVIRRALDEDVGDGDVTTRVTVPPGLRASGVLVAKAPMTVAGLDVAARVFAVAGAGETIRFVQRASDGDRVAAGAVIAEVEGPASVLLTAERTALNLLQRLSGIATTTRAYVDLAAGRITILDTRKTTPGLRALEKYAVRVGGGTNHRFGLFDLVLIKDNHARLAGGVRQAIAAALAAAPGLKVEAEAQSVAEAVEAAEAGADIVLLDNLTTPEIREAVARIGGRVRTEISGGVTLDRIPELATTGADSVSVGALTHSVGAADISLEIGLGGDPPTAWPLGTR
jgi:nicotinate-nucleotide pyrophosphorylase (carboxylating)